MIHMLNGGDGDNNYLLLLQNLVQRRMLHILFSRTILTQAPDENVSLVGIALTHQPLERMAYADPDLRKSYTNFILTLLPS
jgi:hypothetical protein